MTETTIAAPTTAEQAEANARWLAARLDVPGADLTDLRFLRFRPLREVTDVRVAAETAGLVAATSVLRDAEQLAAGHTGGPAPCPAGYVPLDYPVSDTDRAELLEEAERSARNLRLPGADRGWSWAYSADTDPTAMTVTVTLTARHPRLDG